MVIVNVRQNDTRPYLDFTLTKDAAGTAHDLTGATVKFSMSPKVGGNPKVNEASVTIVDATAGQVRYTWAAADTDTVGKYFGEFEVTFSDSTILTFPEDDYIRIHIIDELG